MRSHRFILPVAVSLAAVTLFAHETFLAPNLTVVPVGGTVRLDLSSTAVFPIMETAILPLAWRRPKYVWPMCRRG